MYALFAMTSLLIYLSVTTYVAYRRQQQQVPHMALLHIQERHRLEQTTQERFLQQLRINPAVRTAFIELCLPEVPQIRQRLESSDQDQHYLLRLTGQYLHSLNDTQLIEFNEVLQSSPGPSSLLLERSRAYQVGQQRYTLGQKLIVSIGLIVALLMLIQPPWVRRQELTTYWIGGRQERLIIDSQLLGYYPLWTNELPKDQITPRPMEHIERSEQEHSRSQIAYSRLTLQLALLTLIISIAIWCVRSRPFYSKTSGLPARGRWMWTNPS